MYQALYQYVPDFSIVVYTFAFRLKAFTQGQFYGGHHIHV